MAFVDRLKLLTLNIWHREAPWEQRRALIRNGISALSPDIIGLQEVLELTVGDSVQFQAAELDEDRAYPHRAYASAWTLGPGLEFGNAVLSRYPIIHQERVELPGAESGETRCVLYVRVETPVGEVPVFCTHLNWKLHHGSVRIRQVQALTELVADRAPLGDGFPPVLMGDFNAEPPSDEIRYMRGFATLAGESVFFADAWAYGGDGGPGYTFDRRNPYAARSHEPPRRIDYIFVRGPDRQLRGEPLETRVVFDEPEGDVWPSDHFGLYTELSVGGGVRVP